MPLQFFGRLSRRHLLLVPVGGLVAGSTIRAACETELVQQNEYYKSASRIMTGSVRACKLLTTVSVICVDYGIAIFQQRNEETEFDKLSREIVRVRDEHEQVSRKRWNSAGTAREKEYREQAEKLYRQIDELSAKCSTLESSFSAIHRRSALRLQQLCESNGGVYIKLGQHISQLDYLIPKEVIEVLRKLLKDTPRSPYSSVRNVIKEELGCYPEEMWEKFEEEPIASASLAQVHVAWDKEGRKYAVKVQHNDLQYNAESDIAAVSFAVEIVAKIFSKFNYNWLAREMQLNLPLELNFEQEAANLNKCKTLLKDMIESGDLALPEVGSYITDHEAMQSLNVPLDDIARVIARTFCEQIFRHGFVHCDPHLGNILVRSQPNKSGKAQIVLLDHGLYRQLDDDFRLNYCRLWKALLTFNKADVEKYCRNMNAGDLYPLLSSMLTLSAWDDITSGDINRLRKKATRGEHEKMKTYAQKYIHEINKLMEKVPSSLLLLLKTNDCLRALDKEIGAPINTLTVTADIASRAILKDDIDHSDSWRRYIRAYSDFIGVQFTVLCFAVASYYVKSN